MTDEARRRLEQEANRSLAEALPVRLSHARAVLGVSDNTVRSWVDDGRLPVQSERPIRVALSDVVRLRDQAHHPAVPDAWFAEGLVRSRRVGDSWEIAPGEEEYLASHRDLLEVLRETVRALPLELVVLFGSAARGDDKPGSDLDLLVASAPTDRALRRRLSADLGERLDRVVDVTNAGDAERNPLLLLAVIDEGRVILDRAGAWQRLRARRNEFVHGADDALRRSWQDARQALDELRAGH